MILNNLILAVVASFFASLLAAPFVKKLAIKINAMDKPNARKVHQKLMPRMGGLSIVIGFGVGLLILQPQSPYLPALLMGALVVIIVGILDDIYTLSPILKLIGQVAAAVIVVSSGLTIDKFTLPFSGPIYLEMWSYPVTILWIVGITNAINLIDGLDGLAAGVSAIAMSSILIMAVMHNQILVIMLCAIMISSTLGFLPYNFYPAKIFMGDTGALFLGYIISVISMLGLFKNVTLFSFVIPIIILAIPIFDTFFAIIRRILNRQSISEPDKQHLHYRLLGFGFNHKTTVLIIYSISLCFGISAILFSKSTLWASFIIIGLLLILIQLGAEFIGLIGQNHKPIINTFRKLNEGKKLISHKDK